MGEIERYEELRDRLEKAKQEKAKLEGEMDSIIKQMRKEFGVSDIVSAKKLLASYNEALEADKKTYDKLLKEVEKELA